MICAMTARRIAEGKVDEFLEKFGSAPEQMPPEIEEKFKAVYACRDVRDPNTILTFGLFDGTYDEFRELQSRDEREEQLEEIDPLVEEVVFDGSFDVIREFIGAGAPAPS